MTTGIEIDEARQASIQRVREPVTERKPGYTYAGDYDLPPGKLCLDCFAADYCVGIGCTTPTASTCSYLPVRFREAQS